MADSVYFSSFFFASYSLKKIIFFFLFFIQLNLCPCKETKKGKRKISFNFHTIYQQRKKYGKIVHLFMEFGLLLYLFIFWGKGVLRAATLKWPLINLFTVLYQYGLIG